MSTKNNLSIELTDGQIKDAVAVALAECFSPERRDALIRDIIREHLTAKRETYSRETLLTETVGRAIKAIAEEALKVELEKMEPEVHALIAKQFGEGMKDSIFEQLKTSLSRMTAQGIQIKVEFTDWED